jgi:polyhydroxybutyrate depolymerase
LRAVRSLVVVSGLGLLLASCAAEHPQGHDPNSNGGGEGEGAPAGDGEGEGAGNDVGGEGEGVGGEGEGAVGGEGEGEGATTNNGACNGQGANGLDFCTTDSSGDFQCTIDVGGVTRDFIVHVPATWSPASTPLVLNFHGLQMDSALQRWVSLMDDESDADGYVVAYPNGIGKSFNAGFCCGTAQQQNVDDVGFAVAIVNALSPIFCIDPNRVYSTGISNGGHMSYTLACERADIFAAVAPVAGVITTNEACNPSRPVSILHFHGTSDAIVSYSAGIAGVGAVATAQNFAGLDGCSSTSSVTLTQGSVSCQTWSGCTSGNDVELCTVNGGGHTWPGGNPTFLGTTTQDVNATSMMSQFFADHAR